MKRLRREKDSQQAEKCRPTTKKMIKKSLYIYSLALFLIWLFDFSKTAFSAEKSNSSHNREKIILKLKWKHQFQFAGYYAAIEKGFYRKVGFDVQIVEASDYSEPVSAVLKGESHFGIGGSDLVVLRAKGEKIVALAAIFQHSPLILLSKRDNKMAL
jgi:ABC-type nitrate/sulfonate/bicarbonate transport system substrate-binding protein